MLLRNLTVANLCNLECTPKKEWMGARLEVKLILTARTKNATKETKLDGLLGNLKIRIQRKFVRLTRSGGE
jgi:hypothetical protein